MIVALHPEGVDRNRDLKQSAARRPGSPSTRRAWIEIGGKSVIEYTNKGSPSTRRAWIEIQ